MNELQIFNSEEFGNVRTITIDNEPWFVGKDVAIALGYTDINHAILDHVSEDDRVNSKTQGQNDPQFGQRGTWLINESGMYALIFGSKLDSAQKFKRWVTSEVLPTIRKTGGYVANDDLFIATYLPDASDETKLLFKGTLETVRKLNKEKLELTKELEYKEDVIIGLVKDIDIADKRQIITRVVRKGANNNYGERYAILYREFEQKYHCDLQRRLNSYNESHKPKIKNKMDYIDKVMEMIPELYDLCAKLFENDVNALIDEMYTNIS